MKTWAAQSCDFVINANLNWQPVMLTESNIKKGTGRQLEDLLERVQQRSSWHTYITNTAAPSAPND